MHMWGPEAASTQEQLEHCHPLRVEVFSVEESALEGWEPPATAAYQGLKGRNGLRPVAHDE